MPGGARALFVHGDSFAYTMLHFLCESFGRLFFLHRPTLDPELVLEERPDAVITFLAERFLVRVPQDQPYTPLRIVVQRQQEAGSVLPPRTDTSLRVTQEVPPHLDPWAHRGRH